MILIVQSTIALDKKVSALLACVFIKLEFE